MSKILFLLLAITGILYACIGNDYVDDRVDPVLRISNSIDSLAVDSSYQFMISYLNNVGKEEEVVPEWASSADQVISIDENGLATALSPGAADIQVSYQHEDGIAMDIIEVGVGENTVSTEVKGKNGIVNTTSSYKLTGAFTLTERAGGGVQLAFGDDYEASTALPGLYVYLSNNPSTTNGAFEIQAVEVFAGAHEYDIDGVSLDDYAYVLYFCKPFNVKVGHGEIEE